MAKATMTLPDGTKVIVEGSPDEIKKIVNLYREQEESPQKEKVSPLKLKPKKTKRETSDKTSESKMDVAELVNLTKNSDEIEKIELNILDRNSVVDRILLPLYIVHQYGSPEHSLTSGDIKKYLSQFSINIAQPNIANYLSSSASKYVIADTVRQKGRPVKYKISRRGLTYIKSVIKGDGNE